METVDDSIGIPERSLGTWLFNPFLYIAGSNALIIGISLIILASFIGSLSNSHFDGVLDFHTGSSAPMWIFIIKGLIDWIIMGVLLFLGGLLISKSRFRAIDVIGTQALARFPTVIVSSAFLLPGMTDFAKKMALQPQNISPLIAENIGEFAIFVVGTAFSLLLIIWMVYLMYRAFSVSCNVKGRKSILLFTGIVIIGEILSKFVLVSVIY